MNRLRDKEVVKWSKSTQSVISRNTQLLLNILSIGENGQVKTTEISRLNIYLKILATNVSLEGVETYAAKQAIIRKAFFLRLKNYKKQDIYYFRRAVAAEVRDYLSQPLRNYWILFPLHIPHNQLDSEESIRIQGKELLFRDWAYIQDEFEFDEFMRKTLIQLGDREFTYADTFSPVLVEATGRDYTEAFRQVERSFDFLRCLVNLRYQFGIMTQRWGGYPRPLGKILPPPTYGVFDEDRAYAGLLYTIERYHEYEINNLDARIIPETRKLAARLHRVDNKQQTLNILVSALEKYGEALDAFEWRLAFLTLWQILELISHQAGKSINMRIVKNRIIALLGQESQIKDLLNALYETRNSLVHQGVFPDDRGLREVNLLKYVVERALNKFFSLTEVCSTTASLERYYQYISQNNAELTDQKRIIDYILESR